MEGSNADERVRLREKLGMGSLTLSINLVEQFVSTFLLYYLTDVFGLLPALAGVLLMLGRIWDGVNDPILGFFADNRRFRSGERVRPYALYFCGPLALMCVAMFAKVNISSTALKFTYALLVYLIFDTVCTLIRLPAYGLPMLATSDVKERISINAYVSGAASLGGVLASLALWPIVRAFGGTDASGQIINQERGFLFGSMVIGAIIIAGCLHCYFSTRERVKPIDEKEEKISAKSALMMLVKNKSWLQNSVFTLLYFSSNIVVTSSIAYYATYVLKAPGRVTAILGAFAAGSLLILPMVSSASKRYGRRVSMVCGSSLLILSKVVFLLNPRSLAFAAVGGLIMGMSVGFNIVLFSTNRADLVDLLEWKHGRRIENVMSTLSGFVAKCGSSVASLMVGFGLQLTGYVAGAAEQTAGTINMIISYQSAVPLVFGIIMLLISLKVKLDEEVARMNAEKAAKGIS
ncbi:MAG: MFS transporter [Bacillota bacterium]|jgi:sugar (glycoside-pentoside-hexuronide) transporter